MSNATPADDTNAAHCPVHGWCDREGHEDHEFFHASATIDLADSDGTGSKGWWAGLGDSKETDRGVQVVFEGILEYDGKRGATSWQMDREDLAGILLATADQESYDRLWTLVVTD